MKKRFSVLICFFSIVLLNTGINATTITSSSTGSWSSASTWVGGVVPLATDTVVIAASTNVTVVANTTVKQLIVNNDGYLTLLSNKTLTITGGHLTVDGLINGAGALSLNTAGCLLSGSGSIENTGTFKAVQNVTIPSTATLIKSGGSFTINDHVIVTNNGSLTVYGAIAGVSGAANAQFVNAANAYLSVGTTLMNTGLLNASAIGNTVDYASRATQTIFATTYHHLSLSGAGTKKLSAAIAINGDLTCTSPFNPQSNDFSVAGNFTNSNTFTYGTGTVTLNGTANQQLTLSVAASQSFYNLLINKLTGIVNVGSNMIVRNTLTMTSGNIDNTGFTMTLGTATSARGTLNYTSGTIIGTFERWFATSSTGTTFLYPIGSLANYRPVNIAFANIATAGKLAYTFTTTPPDNAGLPLTAAGITSYNNFNDGQWIATGTSLVSTNYNLTLDGNGFTAFPFTANTRILTNTSGSWVDNGTHGTQVNTVISRTAITGVTGSFAFASDHNCTLPSLVTISGTSLPCKNTTVSYSVSHSVGSTYAWTIPAGASISGPTTTNTISVVFGATTGSGVITVKETNSCGQGPLISQIVHVGPVAPTLIQGYAKVAEGNQGIPYYVDSIPGYSYTWSISNGTIVSGQTKGRISVDFASQGTSTLNVIALGCTAFTPTVTKTINVAKVLVSTDVVGDIDNPDTWQGALVTATSNILINTGAVVTVQSNSTVSSVSSLTIEEGATFVLNKNFSVAGNFVLNGTLNTNGFNLVLNGADKYIRGTGTVINGGTISITGGNKMITSDANLTISGNMSVDANSIAVTNNGEVLIQGDLTRSSSSTSRSWVNNANATLTVNGNVAINTFSMGANATLTVGGNVTSSAFVTGASSTTSVTGTTATVTAGTDAILNLVGNVTTYIAGINATLNLSGTVTTCTATAAGNIVTYIGASPTVKATTYHHLQVVGNDLATLGANTTINGDLNLKNGASLSLGTRTITLKGNFVSTSTATSPLVSGTGTLSFTGTTEQNISSATPLSLYNMTINKASGDVHLNVNTNIANSLTLTLGDVDLNGYTINLSTTGALVSESETARVKGATGSIVATRNVGTNVADLNIAGLGAILTTTTVGMGDVEVTRNHSSFGSGDNQTPHRSYQITPTVNTGLNTTFRATYLTAEIPVGALFPSKLYKSTGGDFFDPSGTGTISIGANYVQLSGISSFSKWVPGGPFAPSNPLPVTMASFTATRNSSLIVLHWTTTMERNNKEFVIERSFDGENFEALGTVAGFGTTNNTSNYHYDMFNASEEGMYFRLKQIDFDGEMTYSKVIVVNALAQAEENNALNDAEFSIFPNPVSSNEIFLRFNHSKKQTVVVKIYDASEKVHYTEEIDIEGNGVTQLFLVPSQTLARGVYYVTIQTLTKIMALKLVVE